MQPGQLGICAAFVVATLGTAASRAAAADERPHIVLVMADDLGYGDPGCYNSESRIPTPHLDALAQAGRRFTDAHAPAAVCVPTRYGLLTGRYPFRRSGRPAPDGGLIEPDRLTLAALLRDQGYRTSCIGKWHLGFAHEKDPAADQPLTGGPIDRGFQTYYGIPASLDIPPYYWITGDRAVAVPSQQVAASQSPGWTRIQGAFWRAGGSAPGFQHADVLPMIRDAAVARIAAHVRTDTESPLFLYVALAAPHTPWLPSALFRGASRAAEYGDFVTEVDAALGEILAALQRNGIAEQTLVVFTSDNGPVWYPNDVARLHHDSVRPLRGMKGDAWEAGHRVPFVVRWPGHAPAGSVCDATICHTDLLASFAALLGIELPRGSGEDSQNVLPLFRGESPSPPIRAQTVYLSSGKVLSLRDGPWKLIPALGSGGFSEPRRAEPTAGGPEGQLYHLGHDIGEQQNLWLERPEMVQRLTAALERIVANEPP